MRCPPGTEIATLLTRIEVDAADPPLPPRAKPIGPVYDEATAHADWRRAWLGRWRRTENSGAGSWLRPPRSPFSTPPASGA